MQEELPIASDPASEVNHIYHKLHSDTISESVHKRYGAVYHIERVQGTDVHLPDLKDDQLVVAGDMETYHFLLTRKDDSIAQFPEDQDLPADPNSPLKVHNRKEILDWINTAEALPPFVHEMYQEIKHCDLVNMDLNAAFAYKLGAQAATQAFKQQLVEVLPGKEAIIDKSRFYKGKEYSTEDCARMGIYYLLNKIKEHFNLK